MKLSISTDRTENVLGYGYLVFYQLFLPSIISVGIYLICGEISPTLLNVVFFIVNFAAVTGIFRHFLWQSLLSARKKWKRCLSSAAMGLAIYLAGGFLFALIAPWFDPDFSNVNDDNLLQQAREYSVLFSVCITLLVPVVEETLFRGLIVRHLYEKNPRLGYCVSIAVFSLIHIVGYIGTADFRTLLLCFIQYIPAGYALAGAYERADNICAPIITHMTINLIGLLLLR